MRSITLIAVLLITGFLYGCGGSGSTSVTAVKQTPMAVFIYGSVLDSGTQQPVLNANVAVTGAVVYSQSGAVLPAIVTVDSQGQLAISLLQVPLLDFNLVFTVTADGYVVNNYTLAIKADPKVKIYQFTVPLVANNSIATNSVVSKTAPVGVLTLSATANSATTTATLAPGTVLRDAGGVALDSSKLTLKVTTYNPNDSKVNTLAPNANEAFMSAGFADITVTDGIRTAVTLNLPVTIRVDFAAGTLNPATQSNIVKDDIITIYTFDKVAGTWNPDKINTFDNGAWVPSNVGEVNVQKGNNGGLYVEYQATHFSYWNIGYRGVVCGNITVPLTGNSSVPLDFSISPGLVAGQTLLTGTKPGGDSTLILQKMPNNNTTYTLTAKYAGGNVGTINVKSCALTPTTLDINVPIPLDPFTYTVEKKCTVKTGDTYLTEAMPNVTVYACPSTTEFLPVPPTPTCSIIGVTNSGGIANGSTPKLTDQKIFVRPNATYTWPYSSNPLLYKSANGTTSHTFDYISTWNFCPVTGANGEGPLVP